MAQERPARGLLGRLSTPLKQLGAAASLFGSSVGLTRANSASASPEQQQQQHQHQVEEQQQQHEEEDVVVEAAHPVAPVVRF